MVGIGIFLTYLVAPTILFIPMSRVVTELGLQDSLWSLVLVFPSFTVFLIILSPQRPLLKSPNALHGVRLHSTTWHPIYGANVSLDTQATFPYPKASSYHNYITLTPYSLPEAGKGDKECLRRVFLR
jgi:hypothetical protein